MDLRALACIILEARTRSEGLWGGGFNIFAVFDGLSTPLSRGLFTPTKDIRWPPPIIEPGENRCIVITLSALMLILRFTFKSSSSSFRSVSSARSNSFYMLVVCSAISSSPRSSLASAISCSVAASITFYYYCKIDFRSA